jgi:glycosyltransferase involved in cell wall biosynthesis
MTRVMHICDYAAPYPGAFIRQLRMLDEELRARGASGSVIAVPERAHASSWLADMRSEGWDVVLLPEARSRVQRHVSAVIRRAIHEYAPEFVHTHFGTYDLSARAAVRAIRIDGLSAPKLVWHYRTALEEPVSERSVGRRVKDMIRFRIPGRDVDRCIGVTQALADEVVARGMPRSRTRAVVAGCDTAVFIAGMPDEREHARAVLGLDPQDIFILHLGWHWHRKGGDLLAEAARILLASGITNMQVASVGAPAELVEYPVRRLAPTDNMASLYQAADIFVSASRSEGFGNGLVEAMSCERVAVAALATGQREVFDDLHGVRPVSLDDADGIATAIAHLINHQEHWAAWGAANRHRIEIRHSMRRWASEMADVYREMDHRFPPASAMNPVANRHNAHDGDNPGTSSEEGQVHSA